MTCNSTNGSSHVPLMIPQSSQLITSKMRIFDHAAMKQQQHPSLKVDQHHVFQGKVYTTQCPTYVSDFFSVRFWHAYFSQQLEKSHMLQHSICEIKEVILVYSVFSKPFFSIGERVHRYSVSMLIICTTNLVIGPPATQYFQWLRCTTRATHHFVEMRSYL